MRAISASLSLSFVEDIKGRVLSFAGNVATLSSSGLWRWLYAGLALGRCGARFRAGA